ncbi:rCG28833 [Rattus norvegicus]|uniref:RCG28833 n=1 Tax=Rattus norvegicus TaxID=10116 RepID=A6HV72_RAT|nr:rCG28833 [Rattus norvegicus]
MSQGSPGHRLLSAVSRFLSVSPVGLLAWHTNHYYYGTMTCWFSNII